MHRLVCNSLISLQCTGATVNTIPSNRLEKNGAVFMQKRKVHCSRSFSLVQCAKNLYLEHKCDTHISHISNSNEQYHPDRVLPFPSLSRRMLNFCHDHKGETKETDEESTQDSQVCANAPLTQTVEVQNVHLIAT